jgi:hypothetical protein
MRDGSRFKIDPNPPVAGQPLTITYIGPASEIEYQVDGQPAVKAKPDKNGKVHIAHMPSGQELALSDNLGIPGYLLALIMESFR